MQIKAATYLHVIVDVSSDKDYVERHRLELTRLFISMRNANQEAVFLPYEQVLERTTEESESVILCERSDYVDRISKIPRSITQLHKYFLKGKPK